MTVLVTASIALAGLLLLAYGYHFIYLKAAPFIGAAPLLPIRVYSKRVLGKIPYHGLLPMYCDCWNPYSFFSVGWVPFVAETSGCPHWCIALVATSGWIFSFTYLGKEGSWM